MSSRAVRRSLLFAQYVQWMKRTQDAQLMPLEGKPKYLRTVTVDVEKRQAVVNAFRVSSSDSRSPFCSRR